MAPFSLRMGKGEQATTIQRQEYGRKVQDCDPPRALLKGSKIEARYCTTKRKDPFHNWSLWGQNMPNGLKLCAILHCGSIP